MRALIVDDEVPARAKLRRLLDASRDVDIVGEAGTGREAVAAIKRSTPDIIFLDVQMPGLDGFGVLDAIAGGDSPYVVFVTANEQHAIRAFEVGAVDYLLKPYTPHRFERVLERARERFSDRAVSAAPRPQGFLARLLVVDNGRAAFLPTERIDRIEAERNYVTVFCGTDRHRLRATIGSLSARLDPAQFLRVNRSSIVRLDAVREMYEWSHGDYRVVMRDGTKLVWSRRYRAAAEREFGVRP